MAILTELTNTDLTIGDRLVTDAGGAVHGTGIFDDLMESVCKHLDAQFNLERIEGNDYSQVYIASLQSAMSSAVQFLQVRSKSALDVGQAELLVAQTNLAVSQVDKVNAEIELTIAQTSLANAQIDKVEAEIALLGEKAITEIRQREVLASQICLYKEQAKGFYWNAMNKWAKLTADVHAIYVSSETGNPNGNFPPTQPISDAKPTQTQSPCT